MAVQLKFFGVVLLAFLTVTAKTDDIECPFCDKRQCLHAMYQLECGSSGYARDVCGCCFRCAAGVNDMCGGFRNLFGQCGYDMYCKPQPIPYKSDQPIPSYGYCVELRGARYFQFDLIGSKTHVIDVVSEELREQQLQSEAIASRKHHLDDNYEAFQMDDSNLANSDVSFVSDLFSVKNDPKQKWSTCEPPCTFQYCSENPRAVCSAKNILRPYEECGKENSCQHTSCLACGYEPDVSICGHCEDDSDQRCMDKYGRCVKTMRRVTRKNPHDYIKQGVVSYECAVPKCADSTPFEWK